MKENLILAFGLFVIWGNIISLFLPSGQYPMVVRTVDFVSAIFLVALVIVWTVERKRRK